MKKNALVKKKKKAHMLKTFRGKKDTATTTCYFNKSINRPTNLTYSSLLTKQTFILYLNFLKLALPTLHWTKKSHFHFPLHCLSTTTQPGDLLKAVG